MLQWFVIITKIVFASIYVEIIHQYLSSYQITLFDLSSTYANLFSDYYDVSTYKKHSFTWVVKRKMQNRHAHHLMFCIERKRKKNECVYSHLAQRNKKLHETQFIKRIIVHHTPQHFEGNNNDPKQHVLIASYTTSRAGLSYS